MSSSFFTSLWVNYKLKPSSTIKLALGDLHPHHGAKQKFSREHLLFFPQGISSGQTLQKENHVAATLLDYGATSWYQPTHGTNLSSKLLNKDKIDPQERAF